MATIWIRATALAFAALCISGTAAPTVYSADPIEVKVNDAATGMPIEGVNVVAAWELRGGFEYGSAVGYVNILETATDKDGRFQFPGWGPRIALNGKVRLNAPLMLMFKNGYRMAILSNNGRTGVDAAPELKSDWNGKVITLKRFDGTSAQYKETMEYPMVLLLNFERNGKMNQIPQFMCSLAQERTRLQAVGVPDAFYSSEWLGSRGVHCPKLAS